MCLSDEDQFVTCTVGGVLKVWSFEEGECQAENSEVFDDEGYRIVSVVPYEDTIIVLAEGSKIIKKLDIHSLSSIGDLELTKPVGPGITCSISGSIMHLASERNIFKLELEEFTLLEDYWDRNVVTCMNSWASGQKNVYVTSQINAQARENKNTQIWSSYFAGEKIEAVASEANNVLFILGTQDDKSEVRISLYSLVNFFRYGKITITLPHKPVDFHYSKHTDELVFFVQKNGTNLEEGFSMYGAKFKG